ncbi:MAG: glycerophosphodiester phosphodiesterase [Micavibrio sp.]|nr:MAG: glycerophosphodiester phosphodiesterase [Micavibrio sp.]
MSPKIPRIIGHRGCAAYAPENTLEGLHTAADMGIEWVEFDVTLTKDQIPILFHDDTLERTTNGHGLVAETTYEDIRQLEAGSWFGDSFAGIKVPTLEEAIDVLIERDLGLNLEIKSAPGQEKAAAEIILDELSKVWDDHERIRITSYNHVSLETALDMASDWPRGVVIGYHCTGKWLEAVEKGKLPEDWAEIADYLQLSSISLDFDLCTPEQVNEIKETGRAVMAYTINDLDRVRILQSMGVDSFFSDAPDVVKDGLLTVH